MEATDSTQHLLGLLNAHGRRFLQSFETPVIHDEPIFQEIQRYPVLKPVDDEEWGGIVEDSAEGKNAYEKDCEISETDQKDDEFMTDHYGQSSNVTIFQDRTHGVELQTAASKATIKALMSSKIAKLRQGSPPTSKKSGKAAFSENEDECTNIGNDAILHRLIHTQLLSGSLNADLDLSPAQRRKSLAGRVLELSGKAKLGKGERVVRNEDWKKASKRVREGLFQKQKVRLRRELEEAKETGNYHPRLKKSFESQDRSRRRKRERGLGMGVGKFRGGLLTLSLQDIAAQGGVANKGNYRNSQSR